MGLGPWMKIQKLDSKISITQKTWPIF